MTHKGHTQKGYATYASFYPKKVIRNMRLTQAGSLIIGYLCRIVRKLLMLGQLRRLLVSKILQNRFRSAKFLYEFSLKPLSQLT